MPGNADPQEWTFNLLRALHATLGNSWSEMIRKAKKKKMSKRGSSTSPISVASTKTLSGLGWSVRYDFKCAVFSELKGDWDAAIKYGPCLSTS